MPGSSEIRMTCHKGWLVLTDERVSLLPWQVPRRKPLWSIQRAAVAGASLRSEPEGYTVLLHTRGGRELPVPRLHPIEALRLVKLLGYSPAMPSAPVGTPKLQNNFARVRCKGGYLHLNRSTVVFVPHIGLGIGLHRAAPWRIARDRISGVSCQLQEGAHMLHNLELHTLDGRTLVVEHVHPKAALHVMDLLGWVPGRLPEQPQVQREAIALHFFGLHSGDAQAKSMPAILFSRTRAARRVVRRKLDKLWERQRRLESTV